jgi:hypothetical protein
LSHQANSQETYLKHSDSKWPKNNGLHKYLPSAQKH